MWVALGRPPRTAGVRYLVKLPQIAQFQRAAQLVFSVSCVVAFGVLFPSPARLTIYPKWFNLQVLPPFLLAPSIPPRPAHVLFLPLP